MGIQTLVYDFRVFLKSLSIIRAGSRWFELVRATRTPHSDSGGNFQVHFRIRREKLLLEVYYGGHRSSLRYIVFWIFEDS